MTLWHHKSALYLIPYRVLSPVLLLLYLDGLRSRIFLPDHGIRNLRVVVTEGVLLALIRHQIPISPTDILRHLRDFCEVRLDSYFVFVR